MTSARVRRGRATQALAADYFRARGWVNADTVGAFLPGRDITGMVGLAPEVKATSAFPLAGLRQAQANAGGDLPFVIWRPNGYGPERIDDWVVALDLRHGAQLLKEAGY